MAEKKRKKAPTFFWIYDQFYHAYITVMVGEQIPKLWKKLAPYVDSTQTQEDLKKYLSGASPSAAAWTTLLPNGWPVVVIKPELKSWSLLIHELVHVAHMILLKRGIVLGGLKAEAEAYYMEFLVKELQKQGWKA